MHYGLSEYLQLLASGLSTGSIYVLIALGLITIYNVTGVVNLAQGEFVMMGAMLAVMGHRAGLPLAVAFLLAVAATMALGMAVQRVTIRPARNAPDVTLIIITVGTAIAIRGLALLIWGTTSYSLPEFTPGAPVVVAGAIISRQRLWIVGAAAVAMAALFAFFRYTLLGKAVSACSINRQAAAILGIDAERMALLAYALSAALGAVAGIVIAPVTLVTYDMGLSLGLKGFVVAVMGGLVNPVTAVIGGLLLGVVEALSSALLTSGVKDAIAFLALFVVLLARTVPWNELLRRRAS